MKHLILILTFLSFQSLVFSQTSWNGKKCAIAFTYDDALMEHLDKVAPLLDSLKFKATFYITANSDAFKSRLSDWKSIAKKGHELGNHTLFHPCFGKEAGREWVLPDYDLSNYTLQRLTDEINMTNTILKSIDGKDKRTFAYPCGDMTLENTFYYDQVSENFVGARGVSPRFLTIKDTKLNNINSFVVNNQTAEELIKIVDQAIESNTLLVFLFHGVGGTHPINISAEEHSKLLHYVKGKENKIWVAPLADIAVFIDKNN